MKSKLLCVAVGCTLGNLIVQALLPEPNYAMALERSYFGAMALLTYWICERFIWSHNE
jgi:hypothetical protein